MMNPILYAILAITLTFPASCKSIAPKLDLTIEVVDDQGSPIEDATVQMSGNIGVKANPGGGGFGKDIKGVDIQDTDEDGKASLSIRFYNEYGGFVEKEGYYKSTLIKPKTTLENGKWIPERSVCRVVLKPKKKPIAMYVKWFKGYIPLDEEKVGFDMEVGDWVKPYGGGLVSDFRFHSTSSVKNNANYQGELEVSFSNPKDGLVTFRANKADSFISSYIAPIKGYENSRKWERSRSEKNGKWKMVNNMDSNLNYYFRVRSEVDDNGNVIKCHYGKIYEDVVYDPRSQKGKPFIRFKYYLNLTSNDQNVEFDPDQNLFKNADRLFAP